MPPRWWRPDGFLRDRLRSPGLLAQILGREGLFMRKVSCSGFLSRLDLAWKVVGQVTHRCRPHLAASKLATTQQVPAKLAFNWLWLS